MDTCTWTHAHGHMHMDTCTWTGACPPGRGEGDGAAGGGTRGAGTLLSHMCISQHVHARVDLTHVHLTRTRAYVHVSHM